MKRSRLNYAIFVMAVATIVSAAVVSCKKQTQEAPLGVPQTLQGFNPLDIQDMNAYLTDFKQKIQSAQKGDDEALSLEDAAWHISSLANFEFANANVECDDVRFDTLYAQVNLTNGTVLLSDLAEAYQTISSSIEKFYNSLTLNNKHFRFIGASISENGKVAISLLTTFSYDSKDLPDNIWYFGDDVWAVCDTCFYYFPNSVYLVSSTGTTELQRVLNLIVSHPINTHNSVYYTVSSTKDFPYQNYTDPYGSPFFNNSRVFVNRGYIDYDLVDDICYAFDSYLGLGHQYCPSDEYILSWSVKYCYIQGNGIGQYSMAYHELEVTYGTRHTHGSSPGQGGN